jgi:hypothetical protein
VSGPLDADGAPLPPVQAAILDEETLEALFRDIDRGAELLGVQVKARPGTYAEAEAPSLGRARELLLCGAVLGVQLRYRLGAEVWCDTLMRTPEGVRLVRVELPR